MVINKSVKPIQPLMPASMGLGSRIFDRYGWSGYYSWHALFMLFRNNPLLSIQGDGEYSFPISLFLKYIDRPGKADVHRLPAVMPRHLPSLPLGIATQPIFMKTLQPGGSLISPGLTSLVYTERPYAVTNPAKESMNSPFGAESVQGRTRVDADSIMQTMVKQPEARYDKGQTDKLVVPHTSQYYSVALKEPGDKILSYTNITEAGKPTLYSYSNITDLFIRWSLINNIDGRMAAGHPENNRVVAIHSSGLEQIGVVFNNSLRHYTTDVARPDIWAISRGYQRSLPVIPINSLDISHVNYINSSNYQSYINNPELNQRIYSSAYKTRPVIRIQSIITGNLNELIKYTQADRFMVTNGMREQRLIELIKREQPNAVLQFYTAAGVTPYQLPLRAGVQTSAGQTSGPDYSRNIVLQYLTDNKPQPVYNIVSNSGNDRYAPLLFTGSSNYINMINSPAISTSGWRPAPVYADLFGRWMEILPGEGSGARGNRPPRTMGPAFGANTVLQAASRANLITLPGIMPLLVSGGGEYMSFGQVPGPGSSRIGYYRAGNLETLVYLQPEDKPARRHPVFNAGTAALIHEARTVTRLNHKDQLMLSVDPHYTHNRPGSRTVQRWNWVPYHRQADRPGEMALRSPIRQMYQPVSRDTGRHTIEYNMISRQMPAIIMADQMARLGLGLQSLLDTPTRDTGVLDNRKKPNTATGYIYHEKLVDQLYRYFEKEATLNNGIAKSFKKVPSSSGRSSHVSTVNTGGENRIDLPAVNNMYLPAWQVRGPGHYRPAGGQPVIQYHDGKQLADSQMIYPGGDPSGLGNELLIRNIAANTVHTVGQMKGTDAAPSLPGAGSGAKGFGFTDLVTDDNRRYRQPAQQGLYAAVRMVDLIIRRAAADTSDIQGSVSAGKNGFAGRPGSETASAQLAASVSPARYVGTVPGSGVERRLNVIQRYLADGQTAYHTGTRPAMMLFRDRSGSSGTVTVLPGNLRTISTMQAVTPTRGNTDGVAGVLSSNAAGFPLNVFKEKKTDPGSGSGLSSAGSPPGMVLQRSNEQTPADTKSSAMTMSRGPEQVNRKPESLLTRFRFDSLSLMISRSVESMRMARERSRSIHTEPIHYAGSFATGTIGHITGDSPVGGHRISAPDQVHIKTQLVQEADQGAQAGPLQRQSKDESDYQPMNGLTHASIFQAIASGVAARRSIFTAAASARLGERQKEIRPDSVMTGVMPPLVVGLETKQMVFYHNQGQNAGALDHRSLLQAMSRGVELNYRQEAAVRGRGHEPAVPTITMDMVQAQIEASKSEAPVEMSSSDIRNIANQVYSEIQQRLKKDRQCRGF